MPSLSIRLDDDTFDKVKNKGGSPWVRDMLVAAIWGGEIVRSVDHGDPLEELRSVEEEFRRADPAAPNVSLDELEADEPAAPVLAPPIGDEPCPRWMHHKPSELCLVCGHQS